MNKTIKILVPALAMFAALSFAGCGNGGDRAYFDGRLTVKQDSVYFTDPAGNITMRVGQGSLEKLGVTPHADSMSFSVRFYGRIDDMSSEDAPGTDIVVYVDKSIKSGKRDTIPAGQIIAGFYECLIDGVKQQLIIYPDYTYAWTIYPDSKYEIITVGSWRRTAGRELLLTPFEEQPDFSAPATGMTYLGSVDDDGEVYFDSTKVLPAAPEITEVDESGISDRVRRSRELNRKMIAEEDAKRRATPRPGVTRFEFDPDSDALVEKPDGTPVFWKVLM